MRALEEAQAEVERQLPELDLPYRVPSVDPLAILWPAPLPPDDPHALPEADEDERYAASVVSA